MWPHCGSPADARTPSLFRTYTDELQALSEAASHELRLVLETLGVGGLVSLLAKLQVPVDPGRGGDLAYLLSCVVTACPGPGSLVPHLPKGAARVFEAGLEAFETDHCLTKRRLVQRCARLRHKFQAATAAAASVLAGKAGGGGAGGVPVSPASLALPPPAPQQQRPADEHPGGDPGGDSYDEEDEDEEEYSDEDEDGEYDEDDDEVDLSDEEEEDFDEELSGEDDMGAGGRRGGALASRRRGAPGAARGRGGVGNGTTKGGRYSGTLCGMASLKRGCASCGLAICRVCWQMEGSLPPGWLDTCTNAECRFTSCLACRRERPCVRCGTHPSSSEVGMLRRRRKTLVLAMNKLCGAAAATLAGNAPAASGGGPGGRGVSPARGAAATAGAAASKKAASVLEAEAAAQAAADQLLREEEAERQAAEDKARKQKEKRDKKKQKGEAAAQAEAATASLPEPPAASTPEKAPPAASSQPPPGASSPATPPPGAKAKGPAQTPSKKKGGASPVAAKAVPAPAAPSSPPVSQAMVDKLVADAAGACDALCSATDGGSAAALDKAIAGAEALLGKWSSSGESGHPDAAAGLQMLMDVILAARAARRSIKPGQTAAANGKASSPASSPGGPPPGQQAPKAGGASNGPAGSKAPPPVAGKPATPVKAAAVLSPSVAPKPVPAPAPAPVSRPVAGPRAMPVPVGAAQPGVMVAPMSQGPPQPQHYQQAPQPSPGMHPPPPGRMMPSPGAGHHPQAQPQVAPQLARNPPPRAGGAAVALPSVPSAWGPPPTPAASTPLGAFGGPQGTPGGGGGVGGDTGGGAFGGNMWRSGGSPFGGAGAAGPGLWTPVMPHAPGGTVLPTSTPPSLGLGNGAFSLGGGSTWGGLMAPSPLPGGSNTPNLWGAATPQTGATGAPPPSLPMSGTSSGNSSSEGLGPSPSMLRPSARLWAGVGTSPVQWGAGAGEDDRAVGSPRGQQGGQTPLMVESMLEALLEPDMRSPVTSPVKAKANGGAGGVQTTSWGAGQHTPPWGGNRG